MGWAMEEVGRAEKHYSSNHIINRFELVKNKVHME